jgi:hypothetical protein
MCDVWCVCVFVCLLVFVCVASLLTKGLMSLRLDVDDIYLSDQHEAMPYWYTARG